LKQLVKDLIVTSGGLVGGFFGTTQMHSIETVIKMLEAEDKR